MVLPLNYPRVETREIESRTSAMRMQRSASLSYVPAEEEGVEPPDEVNRRPLSRRVAVPMAILPWREGELHPRPPGYEPDELLLLYPAWAVRESNPWLLSPRGYSPLSVHRSHHPWIIGDLNPAPPPCKSGALPNELMTRDGGRVRTCISGGYPGVLRFSNYALVTLPGSDPESRRTTLHAPQCLPKSWRSPA